MANFFVMNMNTNSICPSLYLLVEYALGTLAKSRPTVFVYIRSCVRADRRDRAVGRRGSSAGARSRPRRPSSPAPAYCAGRGNNAPKVAYSIFKKEYFFNLSSLFSHSCQPYAC